MYRIVKKEALKPTVTLYEIEAPMVAKKAEPGQFIILRVDENGERIPITIHDYDREKGTVTIIVQTVGATTENPSFELNSALLSRCKVFVMHSLDAPALESIIERAESLLQRKLPLAPEARATLIELAGGDGRYLINLMESVFDLCKPDETLDTPALLKTVQQRAPVYDKDREGHYNLISALHKSLRGSDTDAALYWAARMLQGGEDPLYLLRRLTRFAMEDISLADPAALQMAVTAFSNVFVQGYINYFGADCMSGWTAYTKVDQLVILPVQSIAMAGTTFVGQNLGVGDTPRAKKGVRIALYLSFAVTAVLLVPVLLLAPDLTAFFNSKAEVVSYGALLLRLLSPFYFFFCINQVYSAALRGAGNSQMPMWIMLGSFVVFRQIYLYITAHFIANEIVPIALSYPAGWFVCSAATLLYYRRCRFDKHRLVEDV